FSSRRRHTRCLSDWSSDVCSSDLLHVPIVWAGTDDGNVQVTRDGGKTWTNVAANVPGVGPSPIVSWVEASRYDEGTAYATFDRRSEERRVGKEGICRW